VANLKISDLPTDVGTLASGDKLPIADVSAAGVNTYATMTEVQTFVWTAPTFAAGTASAGTWPKFTSGTVMTTAEDGAIELDGDCFYACTNAGNRGVVTANHFIRADSVYSLVDSTSSQKIFNSPTNCTLTLETGLYKFNALLRISSMSPTSGNALIDWLGAGTATAAAWLWHAWGWDNNGAAATRALNGSFHTASASGVNVMTANTNSVLDISVRGTFTVTGSGTIIPSLTLLTGGVTPNLSIGASFEIARIGSTSAVSVGQWS
tara:strand:- start:61 stop:855 length:795 start_codon:yes stop_codon:yes gene_type:complete